MKKEHQVQRKSLKAQFPAHPHSEPRQTCSFFCQSRVSWLSPIKVICSLEVSILPKPRKDGGGSTTGTDQLFPRLFIHPPACGQGYTALKSVRGLSFPFREEVASFPARLPEFTQYRDSTQSPLNTIISPS